MSQLIPKTKMPREGINSIHLYDHEKVTTLLEGVFLASGKSTSSFDEQKEHDFSEKCTQENTLSYTDLENLNVSDKMICSTCNEPFTDRAEQIQHYKSDWHRFNLKQKMKGEQHLSRDKFEEVTGEISSISGSETDSDRDELVKTENTEESSEEEESYHIEGIGRRHPRVFLRNSSGELFSLYRCLLHGKRNQVESVDELIDLVVQLPHRVKWIVIMVAGGHFAAAVFEGSQVVAHKTFHRYVVRAKRGTAQSTHDGQGGHAKSVGAFMRRHHEAALYEDIKKLLIEWSGHLKACTHIFLRAPGSNHKSLFTGKDCPLNKQDVRLHMVPFPTRRPTFNEVKRVHDILSTVHCYGLDSKFTDHISPIKSKKRQKQRTSPREESEDVVITSQTLPEDTDSSDSETELVCNSETINMEELKEFDVTPKPKRRKKKKETKPSTNHMVETQENVTEKAAQEETDVFCGLKNDMYTAVKVGDLETVKALVQQLETAGADIVTVMNEAVSFEGNRWLHIAAQESHPTVIRFLLEAGANPSLRNKKNEFAYVLSKDKGTRNEFRRFVADYPDKYDYAAAQIPGPLTSEMEEERRAKEAEKRKLQKKAKKERLQIQRKDERVKQNELKEKDRFLNLSDREKRALTAERRFTSQLKDQGVDDTPILSRCYLCGLDITGKLPFEYSDNKFCTTKCLKQHRLKSKT